MAELELAKALKDLPYRVQSASLKERKEVIECIINVLQNSAITESIIRGLCRVIQLTLARYRDTLSQLWVRNLIVALLGAHPAATVRGMAAVLVDVAAQHKNLVVTPSTCHSALCALHWASLVVAHGWKLDRKAVEEHFAQIIEAQACLLTAVVAAGCGKRTRKALNLLNHSFNSVPNSEIFYLDALTKAEQTHYVLVLASAVAQKLEQSDKSSLLTPYIEPLMDTFIKSFISCKQRPLPNVIIATYPLVSQLSADLFKKSILPALQKAMLRNPELILECVGLVISGLKIDVSPYALDLSANLIVNLYSKDEIARNEAIEVCRRLATKVTEPKTIDALLTKLFAVFHGSAGKLTIVEHKLSVLHAIGCLSETSADVSSILTSILSNFVKILTAESHEKTLCYCIEMLTLWMALFDCKLCENVFESFKIGFQAKTATSLVKIAYLKALLVIQSDYLKSATILTPILLKSVEKATQQPTQTQIVTEALCSACFLLKLSKIGDVNLQTIWPTILEMDKQIFINDKFLSSATDDGHDFIMNLAETLLIDYCDKLNGKQNHLHRAIIYCVTLGSSQVRRRSLFVLKRMVGGENGAGLARSLFGALEKALETSNEHDEVGAHALIECITSLCSSTRLTSEQAQLLALDALLPAHQPAIVAISPNLWIKIVKHLHVKPKNLILQQSDYFVRLLIENYRNLVSFENALGTILSVNGELILPRLISTVVNHLTDPAICQVSKDDYFTFLTPEGELYDKSVIQGSDSSDTMNLKRESKAYSYKEQLEELQLRREIEEKKKKDGKIKPITYTPKQLEAIKNQKVKEANIRHKLNDLNKKIIDSVSMIKAAAKGNPLELSLFFKDLLPAILNDLQSPLAAPYLSKLFIELRFCVFPLTDTLGELIANVTLRLLKPQCDLDVCWEAETLNKAMVRTISLIHAKTTKKCELNQTFTIPTFCYTFILIKAVLLSQFGKNNDELVHDCLQIVSEHAKLRGLRFHYQNPKFLPIRQIFEVLVEIISRSSGRVQTQAEACLLDVAGGASGEKGCAFATCEEIDVLLTGLQNSAVVVRDAALRSLILIVKSLPNADSDPIYYAKLSRRIWIAKYDDNDDNCALANRLYTLAELDFKVDACEDLLPDIEHPVEVIQSSASKSLAAVLEKDESRVEPILRRLLKLYRQRLEMIPARLDEFGRELEKPIDTYFPRRGVALALNQLSPLITESLIGDLVQFFVSNSLSDRNEIVRKEMLNAALHLVDLHGKNHVGTLWPVFDTFMGKSSKSANFDAVKQAVVILMGSLARHLDENDERIKPIVLRLIQALSTPSQTVQEAVGNCLPYLIKSVRDEAPGYINKLLHQLLKGDKYGERKGAAYGLAGIVKGMGILVLKQHDIMTKLTEAIQDKKNYKFREGALFAFEMLFHILGKLFEPYIIHVLPHLLQCFGDTSQHVRTAADDTAKVVMSKLSGHGVKLVLPSLLDALEQDSWRTKTGSVELLGAMAYCAPKQLSSCLPSIVPKLIEVLSDSHLKVQEAGAAALKVIGSVIRNPEIQAIVPVLLKALQDPSNKTSVCLQTLLDTQFVHFIDAPSLALIMPVVQRAFMDRSTETRKMAAQIIGNMYSLTDQKDLLPYLPTIIPGLKTSLLDPVPEVRSVSARALGAMVRGMGESSFEDLLPWLMQTLTSESSSVDRSGAAQGLSEVVGGLGVEKLHKLMPEIIATAERTDIAPHVKDGYIMMFIYMPAVFTNEFLPYIGLIINPILKALADENEYVRDTALKAGQRIVTLYADSAILLLLPELEGGLFDENWRIRYSSVQLLGDLLYRISGVTGKMSTETASEDDNFGTEQSHQAIINSLGAERRNRVLAGLYMGRSDVALMVRQAALHVWKVVVTNTPRTLREILPTLFGLLLGCLASDSYDKRQVAARTLGDLVRKLGERVLPEIIPILERGLQSDEADQRQGVCIGLSEIMASTSRDMVLTFVNSLVPTVRKALCDPLPEVRHAAAKTFDSLHATVGARALDDILPTMLNQLNSNDAELVEWTLDGLRQVMAIKSRVVLPYLVPQLTAPPANTKALSILASVAGEALNKYLPKILPALQMALATARGTLDESKELEYCQAVILSVGDEVGLRIIIDTMLENTKNEKAEQRRAAATLLCGFCANSKAQYVGHIPQLLRGLIYLCTDSDRDVLQMAWEALNAITKQLEPKQQATYVGDVRQAVRYAISDMKKDDSDVLLIPGFCLPKGIAPILPIFREAILNGDGDEKETAAQGLGEIIKVTSAEALQPSVVAITGPLIRILGDRFSANVKTAVLETLAILLGKVGVMLKQFLPQLQTTFVKALNDPSRIVRLKSAYALSYLILIHQRADPLFLELHNTVKNTDDGGVRETTLHALRGIITPAGEKMSETVRKQIYGSLVGLVGVQEDGVRLCASGCLGAICRWLGDEQLEVTLMEQLFCDDASADWMLRHGRSAALSVFIKEAPALAYQEQYKARLIATILTQLSSDKVQITQTAIRSIGYLFQHLMITGQPLPPNLLVPFVRTMNHTSIDVKQLLARVCTQLARQVPQDKLSPDLLKMLLPTLVNGTKEKNGYVRANSELALIAVLRLREGDAMQQKCLNILDVGARESLADVVSKVLKKVMSQTEGKDEELDDTLLT